MTAYEYIKSFDHLPHGCKDLKTNQKSNSQIMLRLKQGAVTINGKKPQPYDEIEFPIKELVFYKGKQGQVTIL